MTDYPSIKPEDVREGDVVRGIYTYNYGQRIAVEGEVISKDSRLRIGAFLIRADLTDLRLVSRPTPPEPPVWVGDWVRDMSGIEFQLTDPRLLGASPGWRASLTRIEPPVGWPVGVPDGDAPGGVRWWVRDPGGEYRGRHDGQTGYLEWSELVAAGGVPALAVTR